LIPLILKTALGKKESINIFGENYKTEDGTCIRNYIHIADLSQAHLLALNRLLDGLPGGKYNLGNGSGYSVKEVIEKAQNITGRSIPVRIVERRPGDTSVLFGSNKKAIDELGWKPEFPDIHSIIETAWKWHKNHPEGYQT
ncbi:MAG: GDP-mannose 4,6-dehydratase, partial [Deltaproteobacteria bacterium]|nr:GDP-mannose 4,6-dehydratase [Deltaproteobacteria bacterium]